MNRALVAISLAGLTATASAQAPTLRFTADTTDPGSLGTANWTVSLTGITSGAYLQAYDLDIIASVAVGFQGFDVTTPFATALSTLVGPTPGAGGFDGSILGASGGQSTLVDPLNATFGDVVLGTFSVKSAGPQLGLTYDIADGGVLNAPFIRIRTGSDLGPVAFEGRPNVVSDVVNFTPAPSAAALLAFSFAAARRRR
ncbi:MAG: hypothetical protein RIB32_01775 [Phycisphaerales bacterium]